MRVSFPGPSQLLGQAYGVGRVGFEAIHGDAAVVLVGGWKQKDARLLSECRLMSSNARVLQ